jgi:hypothetical protein
MDSSVPQADTIALWPPFSVAATGMPAKSNQTMAGKRTFLTSAGTFALLLIKALKLSNLYF